MNELIFAATALFLWNCVTFSLYGIDKRKAKRKQWRISERTLITCAFVMGGVGALAGMYGFRHKTKHLIFKVLIPLAVVVNAIIVVCCLYLAGIL